MDGIGATRHHDFYYVKDIFGEEHIGQILLDTKGESPRFFVLDLLANDIIQYEGGGFSAGRGGYPMFVWFPGIENVGVLYEKPPIDMSWIGDMVGIPGLGKDATVAHNVYIEWDYKDFISHEIVWKHADRGKLTIENDPDHTWRLIVDAREGFGVGGGDYSMIARFYADVFPWIYAMANPNQPHTHTAIDTPDHNFPSEITITQTLAEFIDANEHREGLFHPAGLSAGAYSTGLNTLREAREYFKRFFICGVVEQDYDEFKGELQLGEELVKVREAHPNEKLDDLLKSFLRSLRSRRIESPFIRQHVLE